MTVAHMHMCSCVYVLGGGSLYLCFVLMLDPRGY